MSKIKIDKVLLKEKLTDLGLNEQQSQFTFMINTFIKKGIIYIEEK